MDFAFSEEQELLRAAAREYLADRWPADRVVATADADPTFDAASWRELADLGWLDESLGMIEHAVLAEETGSALLPAPWFSTVALAGPLLDGELRSGVAAGERAVTLARDGAATLAGDTVSGSFTLVPDLASVTDVVVVAGDDVAVVDVASHPEVVIPRSTM